MHRSVSTGRHDRSLSLLRHEVLAMRNPGAFLRRVERLVSLADLHQSRLERVPVDANGRAGVDSTGG
jgi:hypothetical protein